MTAVDRGEGILWSESISRNDDEKISLLIGSGGGGGSSSLAKSFGSQ